ncbi:AAA family ATPase [Membranicola marinus]|uniref:AAA family ATPase n=1 Tax=Membranihabitans marinus TaxID=1227546 RepID=A0A953HYR8_9BACT|nr:AAA family ATPase [Membranihabitans marinus]MBY5958187.1 AAA family ATPase [Membranihabitans marinus]
MNSLFERNIWSDLMQWKQNYQRKPLIIRGARQVGKTTIIRQFGETYRHFIEFNLEKTENQRIIQQVDSAQRLIEVLSLQKNLSATEWKGTLLFIDEIQESPKTIGFLRYLYEEVPDLHVVSAGSLLEHRLKDVKSFPVGRVNYMYLFPLNFQEYLKGIGHDLLHDHLKTVPLDKTVHSTVLSLFHRYCIVGGMPEIVARYSITKDLAGLIPTYESIWDTYKDDVGKYAENSTEMKVIRHIMETAPALVDKRIKFQNFGYSNYKSREVSAAFRSLDQAKVIQIIYPSTSTKPPVIPDYKKSPRLQFMDTGLLNFELNIQADMLLMDDLNSAYRGAIIPHMITQELISMNTTSYKKPNFWVRDKTQSSAEVDLLYSSQGLLVPIEIKSGATGSLKSLHEFIDRAPHSLAVRMYAGEFKLEKTRTRKGKLFYLMNVPYYLGTYLDQCLSWFIDKYG